MKNFLAQLFGKKHTMNIDVTIIGTGSMGRALATRTIAAGKNLQVLARSTETAATFAAELGSGITSGNTTEAPAGQIVILALPFDAAKEYASAQGAALDSKIVIDISNPVDFSTFDSLTTAAGSSAAEEISALTSATVVKAFNTTFAGPLTAGSAEELRWTSLLPARNPPATLSLPSSPPPACVRSRSAPCTTPASSKASSCWSWPCRSTQRCPTSTGAPR